VSSDAFYQAAQCICMGCHKYPLLNQSYFVTPYLSIAHIKFTNYSSPTIFLRLPSSELLEKHFFRSRANRRLGILIHSSIPAIEMSHCPQLFCFVSMKQHFYINTNCLASHHVSPSEELPAGLQVKSPTAKWSRL